MDDLIVDLVEGEENEKENSIGNGAFTASHVDV